MIIDGKVIAEEVYANLRAPRSLTLGILVGEVNPVINSFVRIKDKAAQRLGVALMRADLQPGATTDDAIRALLALAEKSDGIIVQLPLPHSIDADAVIAAIPPHKDVDGISPLPRVRPPVAAAIAEILRYELVPTKGKAVVVVGSGRLVGKPAAALLKEYGAEVLIIEKGDSLAPLLEADIIISGAGEPGLIRPEHVKDGVVIIDAGTSEIGGKVAGDADPACAEKASVFTPVPGGVGPIAIAMIFKNLVELAKK
ncbi:MAG: bifunctional 5,10-methylenetetrahydrofolate dehydrogenase/5,10-methenyltetrahydrofolate cyclohydrolase [Minisyncoccia bacterium]